MYQLRLFCASLYILFVTSPIQFSTTTVTALAMEPQQLHQVQSLPSPLQSLHRSITAAFPNIINTTATTIDLAFPNKNAAAAADLSTDLSVTTIVPINRLIKTQVHSINHSSNQSPTNQSPTNQSSINHSSNHSTNHSLDHLLGHSNHGDLAFRRKNYYGLPNCQRVRCLSQYINMLNGTQFILHDVDFIEPWILHRRSLELLEISHNPKFRSSPRDFFIIAHNISRIVLDTVPFTETLHNHFLNIPLLRELFIINTAVRSIQSGAFLSVPNLQKLVLERNHIQIVSITALNTLSALRHLSLAHQPLLWSQIMTAAAATTSKETTLKDTALYLPHLEELNLCDTNLIEINWNFFVGMPNLKNVDMTSNNVKKIPPLAFLPLRRLQKFMIDRPVYH